MRAQLLPLVLMASPFSLSCVAARGGGGKKQIPPAVGAGVFSLKMVLLALFDGVN